MEDYRIIGFPEIQHYMGLDGFDDNATLIMENDLMGIEPSTYLVSNEWISQVHGDESDTEIASVRWTLADAFDKFENVYGRKPTDKEKETMKGIRYDCLEDVSDMWIVMEGILTSTFGMPD